MPHLLRLGVEARGIGPPHLIGRALVIVPAYAGSSFGVPVAVAPANVGAHQAPHPFAADGDPTMREARPNLR